MKLTDVEFYPLPPLVRKVKEALDKSPADEVYTVEEMVKRFGVSDHALSRAYRVFPEYRVQGANRRMYWGNPRAISAYLKLREKAVRS